MLSSVLSVEQYLEGILDTFLETAGAHAFLDPVVETDDEVGVLKAGIAYLDGSRLYVFLAVDLSPGHPNWQRFSFHYADPTGQTIFRYCNAPHYHRLPHYPNHKHEGPSERPVGHRQPSVHYIRREIEARVEGQI